MNALGKFVWRAGAIDKVLNNRRREGLTRVGFENFSNLKVGRGG